MFRKKKKEEKQENRKTKIDCKIQFQKQSIKKVKKEKNLNNGFVLKPKQRKNEFTKVSKIDKVRRKNKFYNILFFLISSIICIGIGYIILMFITNIRGRTTIDDIIYEKTFVEGLNSIPMYPRSEFIYKNQKEDQRVQNMLSKGINVYRLPLRTKSEDVYTYYEEQLPKNKWRKIETVTISTEDKLFGQYWVKEERGLRIYVQNNDVWYESILKEEAENKLSERRNQELQRKRILETSSNQLLIPNYAWFLEIPNNYLITYINTQFEDIQGVEIKKIGDLEKHIITPLGKRNEKDFDEYLEIFKEENDFEIIDRANGNIGGRPIYIFNFKDNENHEFEGILLENNRNFFTYAIYSNKKDNEFYQYIINNIKET